MLSFPRDLIVNVYCPGTADLPRQDQLGLRDCGAKGTLETVKRPDRPADQLPDHGQLPRLQADRRQARRRLDRRRPPLLQQQHRHAPRRTTRTSTSSPGYQRLTGGSALDFVRFRHTDSDLYRVARQQQFVQALKEQFAAQLLAVRSCPKHRRRDHEEHRGRRGGGSELSRARRCSRYALFAYDLPRGPLLPGEDRGPDAATPTCTHRPTNIQDAVQRVREARRRGAEGGERRRARPQDRSRRRRRRRRRRSPSSTATASPGAAANAAYLLAQRGYLIVVPPAGATGERADVRLLPLEDLLRPAREAVGGGRAARSRSCSRRPTSRRCRGAIAPRSARARCSSSSSVRRSTATLAPAPPASAPTARSRRTSASTRRHAERSLRDAQRKVPVHADGADGARAQLVADPTRRRAGLRATGSTASTRRCGSSSARAAASTGGSRRRTGTTRRSSPTRASATMLGGREYDLYYSGPQPPHGRAPQARARRYWVVNTLLDSLSNETMLAIAKGLKPLTAAK